jgi:uncharacterized protein YaaN involved in tellurite resistance
MSTEPLDETLEDVRRAVLGERFEAPAPQEKTFEDHVRDAIEAERTARRAERKPAQPSMSEFAEQERRKKVVPKIQRTNLILDQAAAYGYGSDQRRR